jgi:hypothetical protein
MKFIRSIVLAGVLALCVSPAQALLMTSLDISVGGVDYTATFHDFADPLSFNDVWDPSGNGVFGDGEAIAPAFNKTPIFWTDPIGAAAARDAIIAGLGTDDWVDETTGGMSDGFYIPTQDLDPSFVIVYLEGDFRLPDENGTTTRVPRGIGTLDARGAWVTFNEPLTVPEPVTPALLLSGLFLGWTVRCRARRV